LKFWKFIPFLKDFFFTNQVQLYKKALGVSLILIYVFFPFDVIPDYLLLFGIVDDLVIVTFVLERMVKMAPDSLVEKYSLREIL
jgi:uncharacterized membrane protein YkvA (DUF1232 family)